MVEFVRRHVRHLRVRAVANLLHVTGLGPDVAAEIELSIGVLAALFAAFAQLGHLFVHLVDFCADIVDGVLRLLDQSLQLGVGDATLLRA